MSVRVVLREIVVSLLVCREVLAHPFGDSVELDHNYVQHDGDEAKRIADQSKFFLHIIHALRKALTKRALGNLVVADYAGDRSLVSIR